MKYIFSLPEPFNRFVNIEMIVDLPEGTNSIEIQLPAWRPGRYETVNFAKNIRGFHVLDKDKNPFPFKKLSKDVWSISKISGDKLHIHYQYYANQPDAGACFIDRDQLYINPVHCCFFIPERENEKCKVELEVPGDWKLACGLEKTGKHKMIAPDFDTLVDSPFITSPTLQHGSYTMDGIDFNIWLQGECTPDWNRIIKDYEGFTRVQLDMMKDFPAKDYHFLVQLLPYKFYHGVEHVNSTVLALGPGINLMDDDLYNSFMGVASHELFHSWNVKTIRPVEMYPYHFNSENYAETGYVYEGVTTYYGDLFLGRSGFFSLQELLDQFSIRLQKHMDNPGRFNYSVAESSFDTWLDGYVPGVPGRKVSIYDEGCLLALILDFMIMSATDLNHSLDDVMKKMYTELALKGKGYSANDYKQIAEQVAGRKFDDFFANYVNTACSLENILSEILSLAGIKIEVTASGNPCERYFGMRTENRGKGAVVVSVYPGSPAAKAGLVKDDEIIAVNDVVVNSNINELLSANLTMDSPLLIKVNTGRKMMEIDLIRDHSVYLNKYNFVTEPSVTQAQLRFRQKWVHK